MLPQCELALGRCDDAAEFDDTIDQQQMFDDDPDIVVFRKANKIGFSITVTPTQPGDVKVCFVYDANKVARYPPYRQQAWTLLM